LDSQKALEASREKSKSGKLKQFTAQKTSRREEEKVRLNREKSLLATSIWELQLLLLGLSDLLPPTQQ